MQISNIITASNQITPVTVNDNTDVEAPPTVSEKSLKATITHQLCDNFSNIDVLLIFTYVTIVVVAVCAMLVPIFIEGTRINDISSSGIFGDELQTSTRLMIMQSISIGCTLPTISDFFLDQVTSDGNKARMTLSMRHRIIVLSAFSIAGVLYLIFSDCYYIAYLYIILTRSKVLIGAAATFYTISYGTITNSVRSKFIHLIPVLVCAMRFVFEAYNLVYPEKVFFRSASAVFDYLVYISVLGVQLPWFYLVWCRYQRNQYKLNNEEKKETLFMLAMLFYVVANQVVRVILGWPKSWSETGADVLVGYVLVQIICILLTIVIPARFMRKVVQMSEAILQLKREFVRYVSHEIRSPLNVVHAGLELLRADLVAAGALSSTLTLLQDIFFASSAAIEILNDMLQYEHIDSGTFKLDCAAVSLVQVFAGRMDGFKFILANKNISLVIEDQAQVSEFYSPTVNETEQAGSELQTVTVNSPATLFMTPPPTSPASMPMLSALVLFIDRFRVEQIIRNLMTNAVKFTPEGGHVTIRFLVCSNDLHQQQQLQHLEPLSPESVAGFSAAALTVTKNYLRIEIQDSGVGIAIEDQPDMFKQFAQFNRNALQGGGGSGLGLWICKNLAAFHGGRLGFYSEGTGTGSTFFVDLPLYTATEVLYPSITTAALILSLPEQFQREDGHIERSRTMINPPECEPIFSTNHVEVSIPENINPTAQIRVLIVDDSAMNRKMIRRMLESPMNAATMGSEVLIEEADDGITALQALKTATETREDSYKIDNSSAHMHSGFSVTDNNFQEQIAASAVENGELMKKRLCVGFNLIFIDFIMTTMNGPEAVQIMRKELKFTGGIIGVTGNALPADLTYFKECGADLVITKPLTNKRLMDAVHSVTQLQTGTPFHRR